MRKYIYTLALLFTIMMSCSFTAAKTYVCDNAGLLSGDEQAEMQEEAEKLSAKLEIDVVLATTADARGMNTDDYIEAFYQEMGFGYEGKGGSCLMLLIDMDNRQYWYLTTGKAQSEYSDSEIEKMYDKILDDMRDGEYYDACDRYLSLAAKYGGVKVFDPLAQLLYLAISLAVAAVVVFALSRSGGHGNLEQVRRSYPSSRQEIVVREDRFTNTTVVRVPRPRPQQSSHSSGGGGSHGGGGGARGGGRSF